MTKKAASKGKRIKLELDERTAAWLRRTAKEQKRSLSSVVAEVIRAELERLKSLEEEP